MTPRLNRRALATIREKRRLSKTALAHEVGATRGYMWALEAGTQNPSREMVGKLASALGIKPRALEQPTHIPLILVELRKIDGYSRAGLADITGIPELELAAYESGRRDIDDDTVALLAAHFNVAPELLKREVVDDVADAA